MGEIKDMGSILFGWLSIKTIITIGIPMVISYFIIKKAVKNGIKEAHEEINQKKNEL